MSNQLETGNYSHILQEVGGHINSSEFQQNFANVSPHELSSLARATRIKELHAPRVLMLAGAVGNSDAHRLLTTQLDIESAQMYLYWARDKKELIDKAAVADTVKTGSNDASNLSFETTYINATQTAQKLLLFQQDLLNHISRNLPESPQVIIDESQPAQPDKTSTQHYPLARHVATFGSSLLLLLASDKVAAAPQSDQQTQIDSNNNDQLDLKLNQGPSILLSILETAKHFGIDVSELTIKHQLEGFFTTPGQEPPLFTTATPDRSTVNMRAYSSQDSERLGTAAPETELKILGSTTGPDGQLWMQVQNQSDQSDESNQLIAWVRADLLKVEDPSTIAHFSPILVEQLNNTRIEGGTALNTTANLGVITRALDSLYQRGVPVEVGDHLSLKGIGGGVLLLELTEQVGPNEPRVAVVVDLNQRMYPMILGAGQLTGLSGGEFLPTHLEQGIIPVSVDGEIKGLLNIQTASTADPNTLNIHDHYINLAAIKDQLPSELPLSLQPGISNDGSLELALAFNSISVGLLDPNNPSLENISIHPGAPDGFTQDNLTQILTGQMSLDQFQDMFGPSAEEQFAQFIPVVEGLPFGQINLDEYRELINSYNPKFFVHEINDPNIDVHHVGIPSDWNPEKSIKFVEGSDGLVATTTLQTVINGMPAPFELIIVRNEWDGQCAAGENVHLIGQTGDTARAFRQMPLSQVYENVLVPGTSVLIINSSINPDHRHIYADNCPFFLKAIEVQGAIDPSVIVYKP